jgi:hypothetical protein
MRLAESLAATEQRGLREAGKRRERGDRDVDRPMAGAADRDADPVQQRPHAPLANRARKIVLLGGHEIMREGARDVWRRDRRRRGCGLHRSPATSDRHVDARPERDIVLASCDGF